MNGVKPAFRNTTLALAVLLALALTGGDAWARGGGSGGGHGGRSGHSAGGGKSKTGTHHNHNGSHRGSTSSGVFLGYWAFPGYWWANARPYWPEETVYYIERSEEELRSESVWFYCEGEAAYYPHVTRCPAGWVKVEPFMLP